MRDAKDLAQVLTGLKFEEFGAWSLEFSACINIIYYFIHMCISFAFAHVYFVFCVCEF